jgi:hypothetical protein
MDEVQLPLPLDDTHCAHCKQVVPQPFYVVRHFGTITMQFPFCNEECANEYYMERLRSVGL